MHLNFIKHTTVIFTLLLLNNTLISQTAELINNSTNIESEKVEVNEISRDNLIQSESINEENIFIKKRITFNKNNQANDNKNINSDDYKTKIGSLISRIGISINKYCKDNKISGKKILRIGKLFI